MWIKELLVVMSVLVAYSTVSGHPAPKEMDEYGVGQIDERSGDVKNDFSMESRAGIKGGKPGIKKPVAMNAGNNSTKTKTKRMKPSKKTKVRKTAQPKISKDINVITRIYLLKKT